MPVYFDRYEPDHSSIAEFLVSGQLRDATREGAQDVAAIANGDGTPRRLQGSFFVEPGPPVVVTKNGNPRLSERVWSHDPAAAAIEFGSGKGDTKRPQGGSNEPFRILGKAGARVADKLSEEDD